MKRKRNLRMTIILLVLVIFNSSNIYGRENQRVIKNDGESRVLALVYGRLVEPIDRLILVEDRIWLPLESILRDFHLNLETREQVIKVEKNGKYLSLEGLVFENMTYIPLRLVAEHFGEEVKWDDKNKAALVGDYSLLKDRDEKDRRSFLNGLYELSIGEETFKSLFIEEREGNLYFYDKFNYDLDEGMGLVLTILKTENDLSSMIVVPSYMLANDGASYYIGILPSDVQFNPNNKASEESYLKISGEIEEILKSFKLL